ncbi:MAG TPA: hypothetical protein VEV44_07640 [Pseudoneobacillus sp.]|nr:hypothetical protein [Pseudoneobacillus sp.]
MKKVFIWSRILFITSCILVIGGCSTEYTEDYTKDYGTFLDEVLGDWKVVSTKKEHYTSKNENELSKDYVTWDIAYIDKNGSEKILQLKNDEPIAYYLVQHLGELFESEFKKEFTEIEQVSLIDNNVVKEERYYDVLEELPVNANNLFAYRDFTLKKPFETSNFYVFVDFNFNDKNLSKDEQIEMWLEKEKKILEIIPNIHMISSLEVDASKGEIYKNFYIAGEKVEVDGGGQYMYDYRSKLQSSVSK